MLDRLEADLDGAPHCFIGIEMAADVGLRLVRLFDESEQLVTREAKPHDRELARGRAAGRHHLDVLGAIAQLFAHGKADGLDAIDDTADRSQTAIERFNVAPVPGLADVGMTAGLDKGLAADEQARPFDNLLINGALEADIGAAEVADRSEPAQEHLLHDPRSVQRD